MNTFKEFMGENYELSELRDIYKQGCIVGFGGLTYYSDTCKTYDKFEEDIWELAVKQAEELGHDNVMQMIGTFNGAEHVYSPHTFKNLMVWYAAEEYARQIIEEAEEDNDEE